LATNFICQVDREWKSKKRLCERSQCSHLVPEEAYNCVNECLSPGCFDEIYAADPLEDGEIDRERSKRYLTCVRLEAKTFKKVRRPFPAAHAID